MEFISTSEAKTIGLAEKIAKTAKGGQVYALFGDLGSGKTTFVKGFAEGLGVVKTITSPTFVIMKLYATTLKIKLAHLDCYRLKDATDAESLGVSEIINDKNYLLIIEWPERIKEILPKDHIKIVFEYLDEKRRKITTECI